MKTKNFLWSAAIFAAAAFASSCEKDNDAPAQTTTPADSVCLVVNMGNMSESNGSFSLYNVRTDSIANARNDFAAILIDVVVANDMGLASCNTVDKLEFFNPKTFAALNAPIDTGLVTPRMIAVYGSNSAASAGKSKALASVSKAYVTCWGAPNIPADPYGAWTYPNSYIAEIDLGAKTKTRSIKCGNEAEGVYVKGNSLYVAVADGVEVYALPDVTLSKKITTNFGATARRIDEDKNGKLWVSFNGYSGGTIGFAVINPNTQEVEKEITLTKFDADGKFALSKDKSQVLFAAPTSENWVTVSSDIYTINVESYAVSASALIGGTSLSTLGVNPWNGDIYAANTSYTGNSMMFVYSQNGTQKNSAMAGVAPQKFVFY